MAYTVIHKFKDTSREQYDTTLAAVHPEDGSLPPGQVVHVAGIVDGDLVIVAIFDSQQAWEEFRDNTLLPRLETLEGGPSGPPEETTFEAHNFQTA